MYNTQHTHLYTFEGFFSEWERMAYIQKKISNFRISFTIFLFSLFYKHYWLSTPHAPAATATAIWREFKALNAKMETHVLTLLFMLVHFLLSCCRFLIYSSLIFFLSLMGGSVWLNTYIAQFSELVISSNGQPLRKLVLSLFLKFKGEFVHPPISF